MLIRWIMMLQCLLVLVCTPLSAMDLQLQLEQLQGGLKNVEAGTHKLHTSLIKLRSILSGEVVYDKGVETDSEESESEISEREEEIFVAHRPVEDVLSEVKTINKLNDQAAKRLKTILEDPRFNLVSPDEKASIWIKSANSIKEMPPTMVSFDFSKLSDWLMPLKDFKKSVQLEIDNTVAGWPGVANPIGAWKYLNQQDVAQKDTAISTLFNDAAQKIDAVIAHIQSGIVVDFSGVKTVLDGVIKHIDNKYVAFSDISSEGRSANVSVEGDLYKYLADTMTGITLLTPKANIQGQQIKALVEEVQNNIQEIAQKKHIMKEDALRAAYAEILKNLEYRSSSLVSAYILLMCEYYAAPFLAWVTNAILYYRGQKIIGSDYDFNKISCYILYLLKEGVKNNIFGDAGIVAISSALQDYSMNKAIAVSKIHVNTGQGFRDASFDPFGMEIKHDLFAVIKAKELKDRIDEQQKKQERQQAKEVDADAERKIAEQQKEKEQEKEKKAEKRLKKLQKVAERKKRKDEKRRHQEEKRRQEEERKRQEEERRKFEEAQKRIQAAKAKADEEEKKQLEEEAERLTAARKQAEQEAQRQAKEEEAKRQAKEFAKRLAEEEAAKKLADEMKRLEQEREQREKKAAVLEEQRKRAEQQKRDEEIVKAVQEQAGVNVGEVGRKKTVIKKQLQQNFSTILGQLNKALNLKGSEALLKLMQNREHMNPELDFFAWIEDLFDIYQDQDELNKFKQDKDFETIKQKTVELIVKVMGDNGSLEQITTGLNSAPQQRLINKLAEIWVELAVDNQAIDHQINAKSGDRKVLCYYIMIRNGLKNENIIINALDALNTVTIIAKYPAAKLAECMVGFVEQGYYDEVIMQAIKKKLVSMNSSKETLKNVLAAITQKLAKS